MYIYIYMISNDYTTATQINHINFKLFPKKTTRCSNHFQKVLTLLLRMFQGLSHYARRSSQDVQMRSHDCQIDFKHFKMFANVFDNTRNTCSHYFHVVLKLCSTYAHNSSLWFVNYVRLDSYFGSQDILTISCDSIMVSNCFQVMWSRLPTELYNTSILVTEYCKINCI